jgi:hypothetical protein
MMRLRAAAILLFHSLSVRCTRTIAGTRSEGPVVRILLKNSALRSRKPGLEWRRAPWLGRRGRCRGCGKELGEFAEVLGGAVAGDEEVQELARLANRHLPELKTHDRFGNRADWVEFHPSWHQLMALAWKHEVPNLAWRTNQTNGHFARAVLSYVWNQVEQGTGCPTGMAYAAYAGFAAEPALAIWAEKVKGTEYEFNRREVGEKPSVVIGC